MDSDHVPILSDELISIMQEAVRAGIINKVFIGTDFLIVQLIELVHM